MHYDKSPNCPFFTETVEGAPDGNGQGDAVLGSVDASDEEARELPMTVRSKAAAGSKRPTSRNTSATTKARRATAVSVVPPPTVTKSTTRSRIPKTTARSEIEAPALSTTTSRDASDEEKEASDAQPELKVGKTRTKRATTTTVRASAKTTKTASSSTATKGTRRATKAATAESGDDAPKDAPTMAAEDEDTGVDELDALPRSTKSRVKASTRTATSAAKKPVVSRKPVGRAAKTKPVPEAEMIESQTTEVEQSVPSLPVDASDVEMASSRITASETEPSETEKEDSPTDVEEQRREYLAEEEMVKSHRMQMVEVGAREAMAVMQNLGSKRLDTVRALTRDESATPRAVSTKQDPSHSNMDKKLARSSTDDDDDEVIKLTLEEERLTVVEYVRRMYARRREALLGAGEAKIADWEEKAGQARAFIESIPTRN
ncbi:hypothetical protein QFC22_003690 [Naganishia vaughanmartiniae]|uniref:Uncharacterized protein n=1 Tax=Naganishia vaughanmartiniae TaxID=1424756 RepID=A0ACC2X594_9TREE|nr:hypothetical protein QFC22_003690 [Naganishia vaughanmartiniae]